MQQVIPLNFFESLHLLRNYLTKQFEALRSDRLVLVN